MKKLCKLFLGLVLSFRIPLKCNYYFQELIKQSKIKSIKSKYFQIYVEEHVGNPQIRKPIYNYGQNI